MAANSPSWVYKGICNYSFWSLEGPLRKLVTISVKDAQKFESTNINWDQHVWKKILLRFFIGNYTCTQWVLIPPPFPPSCILQGEEAAFELDLIDNNFIMINNQKCCRTPRCSDLEESEGMWTYINQIRVTLIFALGWN